MTKKVNDSVNHPSHYRVNIGKRYNIISGPVILEWIPENFVQLADLTNRSVDEIRRIYEADKNLDQIRRSYFDTRLAYEEVER